jgi:hypothetical protein
LKLVVGRDDAHLGLVSDGRGRAAANAVGASRGYPARMAKTTEQILAEAKAFGIEVTVTLRPKGTGEIVLLPGLREPKQT